LVVNADPAEQIVPEIQYREGNKGWGSQCTNLLEELNEQPMAPTKAMDIIVTPKFHDVKTVSKQDDEGKGEERGKKWGTSRRPSAH